MKIDEEKSNQKSVIITEFKLEGDLCIPQGAKAMVLFVHGSGSSRYSTRNQYVAKMLNDAGYGTLLVDLLSPEEKDVDSRTKHVRFDIGLLACRTESIIRWLLQQHNTKDLSIGIFGSSTGTAAALIAASKSDKLINAIVSRGGRPDLAQNHLHIVMSPILFIIGGSDAEVIQINKRALKELKSARMKELIVIPEAGHLFEEPGKMEE